LNGPGSTVPGGLPRRFRDKRVLVLGAAFGIPIVPTSAASSDPPLGRGTDWPNQPKTLVVVWLVGNGIALHKCRVRDVFIFGLFPLISQRAWPARFPSASNRPASCDRALLALLLLRFEHIQQRERLWAIVDLIAKGGHVRTIPVPAGCSGN
jgi:hypothetical protein